MDELKKKTRRIMDVIEGYLDPAVKASPNSQEESKVRNQRIVDTIFPTRSHTKSIVDVEESPKRRQRKTLGQPSSWDTIIAEILGQADGSQESKNARSKAAALTNKMLQGVSGEKELPIKSADTLATELLGQAGGSEECIGPQLPNPKGSTAKMLQYSENNGNNNEAIPVKNVKSPVTIVTRKFGLRPLKSGMEVDLLPVFSGFERCVNTLIRAGIQLLLGKVVRSKEEVLNEPELEEGEEIEEENEEEVRIYKEGVESIKANFYNPVSKISWVKARIQQSPFLERFWRCAAQYAYYAVKGYNFNRQLITQLTTLFQRIPSVDLPTHLQTKPDFPRKGKTQDTGFPSDALIEAAQRIIQRIRPGQGLPSEAYTTNLLCYFRNLLLRALKEWPIWSGALGKGMPPLPAKSPQQVLKEGIAAALSDSRRQIVAIESELPALLEDRLDAFFRKLSHALTRRVTPYLLGKAAPRKVITPLDHLILRICRGSYPTSRKGWEKARKRWRNTQRAALMAQVQTLDLSKLAAAAYKVAQGRLTPARVLALSLRFRSRLPWVTEDTLAAFQVFLTAETAVRFEKTLADCLMTQLAPHFYVVLARLAAKCEDWVKIPHFTGQAIPLAMDDGKIHKLIDKVAVVDPMHDVILSLSFYRGLRGTPKAWWHFKLFEEASAGKQKRAYRFQEALGRDPVSGVPQFKPLRGVLLRKLGHHQQAGGGLVLALPFKRVKSPVLPHLPMKEVVRVAGIDLGVKVFATVSVADCVKETGKKAETHRWTRVSEEKARYFIDQREIVGKRGEWIGHAKTPGGSPPARSVLFKKDARWGNFKRRLTELQQLARQYQSWKDEYAKNYKERQKQGLIAAQVSYRHKVKYQKWRREWKRSWRKIQGLHQELSHQVATRVVAALERERVRVVLLEDLRWAKQKPREQVGYFLTTWQVHWFYTRVQQLIAAQAHMKGIVIEWVIARGTSVRCSHCGHEAKTQRAGKTFRCQNLACRQALGKKPLQLDADLNGARNIMTALVEHIPATL